MFNLFAKRSAVAGCPISARVCNSASVLAAAGTLVISKVCLRFQTLEVKQRLFLGVFSSEI